MSFQKPHFDPQAAEGGKRHAASKTVTFRWSEEPGDVYVYSDEIILTVNAAMAASRPLLVSGDPGTGKTTLARGIAEVLERKYYKRVVTSRTKATDLAWRFDALKRLSEAQAATKDEPLLPRAAFVEPEALWWCFDPSTATQRGATTIEEAKIQQRQEDLLPAKDPDDRHDRTDAVLLIDEIDKAEPDVPNDLLETLDERRFTVTDLDTPREINAGDRKPFVMITTNGERDLPPAFIRRCASIELPAPDEDWLVRVANEHDSEGSKAFHREVAKRIVALAKAAKERNQRPPSTAEFLDTLEACRDLGIKSASHAQWKTLLEAMAWKRTDSMPELVEET